MQTGTRATAVRSTWPGSLITASISHRDEGRPAPYFRKELLIGPGVRQATLQYTALGLIEAFLNGSRVGDEVLFPGWTSYDHRLMVSSHDVTDLLRDGANTLGAIVGDGWAVGRLGWDGRRAYWSDRPAAYMQLVLEYPDRTEVVVTDESWRVATGGIRADSIYDGETYDARLHPRGWDQPGFDDSAWEPARALDWDLSRLELPEAPAIRRVEEVPVRELIRTRHGRTVADFGQVLTGWVRISVAGPAGSAITLRHCELMVDGEPEFESNRTAEATDRYILRGGGRETWEPRFTFHGFRYVEIDGWPGDLDPGDLVAVVVHSDLTRTGWFETSDEQINQLHRNVVWSFRGNAVGVPSDCPQRDERLGWTGDINAFAATAGFLFDVRTFLGSWLVDLAAEQEALGGVPMVVPDVLSQGGAPNTPTALWGDVAVSLPWTLYMEYGDPEVLRRQYRSMKAFVESVLPLLDRSTGLWTGFQLGDWLDPTAPGGDPAKAKAEATLVANAYLCRSLDQLAASADILRRPEDEAWARSIRARVVEAFRHEWVAPSGRLANESQTSYALAICFGLLDDGQVARAGQRLADLVTKAGLHIGTGFAGTPWLLPALSSSGQLETAYRLLLQVTPPSFLYPVTMGATTVWERWDAVLPDGRLNSTGMTSLNHYALGAVADWLHKVVGGIEAAEPGYRRVRIAPRPGGGLTSARVAHDSRHGRISVEWTTHEGQRTVGVALPEGICGEVTLPGHPEGRTEQVEGGDHQWTYGIRSEVWAYNLDTPLEVLQADTATWERVVAAFSRADSRAVDHMGYLIRRYPTLRAILDELMSGDRSADLQMELVKALEG